MTQKRKTRKKNSGTGDGFIGRLFAQTKLPAHVTEEQDWYLDTPDVRLTRVFTIVLILHVVAIGGILAFKMVEKASTPASVGSSIAGTQATTPAVEPKKSVPEQPKAEPATPAPRPQTQSNAAGLVVDHPSAPGYDQYRVATGDSLVSIARETKVSAAELRELNQLSEDTRLMPGKWLLIPEHGVKPVKKEPVGAEIAKADPKPAAEPAVRPIDKSPAAAAKPGSSYEVQKGDTFFGIARQFGVNYKDLMAANGIASPEGLQAGMKIEIPKH